MACLVCLLMVAGTLGTAAVDAVEPPAPVQPAAPQETPPTGEPPVPEAPVPAPPPDLPPSPELDTPEPRDPAPRSDEDDAGDAEDDDGDTHARANLWKGAGIVGGITAATACACGVVPGTLCSTISGPCGACCAGFGSAGVTTVAAAVGSILADRVDGGAVKPMRLGMAAGFAGGVGLAGAILTVLVTLVGAGVVGMPVYLVTQDETWTGVALAVAAGTLAFVLLGATMLITSAGAGLGYYVGATLE